MSIQRITPVEPPYSPPVQAVLDRIMPEGVPPLSLFRTLAVNERVFLRVMAGGLLDRGSISLRERELVILRTTARLGSEYEWGVHVTFFSGKAGLTAENIAATRGEPGAAGAASLSSREQLLLRAVDELVDGARLSDPLFEELSQSWSPAQLVEIVSLTGFYHLIAFATNAFQLAPEPFAALFSAFGQSCA